MSVEHNVKNDDMPRRVLVTGAGGFIGRHCLPLLLSNGFEVHGADLFESSEKLSGLHWHQVDLLNAKQMFELITKVRPTHLLHFAWYAKPGEFWNSLENICWVEASLHLLRLFHAYGGKRAVMAGTCAEYDWKHGYCFENSTPLAPSTLYGACKNALQHLLREFSRTTGLSSAWGRIFFLYGPYESPERLVAYFISSLIKGKEVNCKHGNLIRDFLCILDAAAAFVSLLKSAVVGAVNIASGNPVFLKDIANTIAEKMNKKNLVSFGESEQSFNEPRVLVADVKRLNSEVGWIPNYDLSCGLELTIDWWKKTKER